MEKKKALLIGINYPGSKAELKGCINDVNRMKASLVNQFGFASEDIEVLIDTDSSYVQPTGANIRKAIEDLIDSAESGDHLFLHYSGHGTRLPAETGNDDDTGYDECIVPCDMNLIANEDFREFVGKVPDGCRITIVSDSCYSGGLLKDAKEQIGDSTKQEEGSSGGFRSLVKEVAKDVLESGGIHISREGFEHRRHKSLSLPTLIEMLKQKAGEDNIDVGTIRATLFDMFGKEASPKVKKFMKVVRNKLRQNMPSDGGQHGGGGFRSKVSRLLLQFLTAKLEKDADYLEPALDVEVGSEQEAYAGTTRRGQVENGILISGCQTYEKSSDAKPPGGMAYGALSNAIQTILKKGDGDTIVSNKELVMESRSLLEKQGFKQHPGLYCTDEHVDAPFICRSLKLSS